MRVAFYLIDLLGRCPISFKLMPFLRLFAMSSAGQTNHDHHFRNYKRQEIEQREDDDAGEFVPVPTFSHLPLPQHWQSFRDKSGRVFYVDHETRRTFIMSILLGNKSVGTEVGTNLQLGTYIDGSTQEQLGFIRRKKRPLKKSC